MSKQRICIVCDNAIERHDGNACTNRCCGECHRRYCSPGGSTSPGHGLRLDDARAKEAARTKRTRKPANECAECHGTGIQNVKWFNGGIENDGERTCAECAP